MKKTNFEDKMKIKKFQVITFFLLFISNFSFALPKGWVHTLVGPIEIDEVIAEKLGVSEWFDSQTYIKFIKAEDFVPKVINKSDSCFIAEISKMDPVTTIYIRPRDYSINGIPFYSQNSDYNCQLSDSGFRTYDGRLYAEMFLYKRLDRIYKTFWKKFELELQVCFKTPDEAKSNALTKIMQFIKLFEKKIDAHLIYKISKRVEFEYYRKEYEKLTGKKCPE